MPKLNQLQFDMARLMGEVAEDAGPPPANPIAHGPSAGVETGAHGSDDRARHGSFGFHLPVMCMPGLQLVDMIYAGVAPTVIPGIGETIDCLLMHTADITRLQCWMQLAGGVWDEWMPIADARRDKLHDMELIEWGRRNDVPDADIALSLQAQGWFRLSEAQARVALYDELPSIADHLHWLQRNVFDDHYVADFQLMEGFEDRFWVKFGHDLRSKGYTKERASLDYAAHWINPAPEQLKEMVYRLDPAFTDPSLAFSMESYQRVLQEQDVGAYFRPRFAAIAYRIPALGYIRDMYRQNVIDDPALKVYHQQLGYAAQDADRFVAVDKIAKARYRATATHGWTPTTLAKAWAVGQVTAAEMDAIFAELGWRQLEAENARDVAKAELAHSIYVRSRARAQQAIVANAKSAITLGVIGLDAAVSMLESIGYPREFAVAIVQGDQAQAQVDRIGRAVNRIRSAYADGEVSADYVVSALQQLGIQSEAIQSYVSIWALEQTPGRRRRTAAQIVTDVADGVMNVGEALVRLTNLGYTDADRQLYLADVRRKVVRREAEAQAADERLTSQRSKSLARLAKEASKQSADIVSQLRSEEPPAKLQQWAALGLISRGYFVERLTLYGFDAPSIDLWWSQACAKKNAACDDGSAESVSAPTVSGGSEPAGGGPTESVEPVR